MLLSRPDFRLRLRRRAAVFTLLALAIAGCAHDPGNFVWVDQLASADGPSDVGAYRIGPGDLLTVQVFGHPEITGRVRVRGDGKVSVSLLGDLSAAERTPVELTREIEQQLEARQLAVAARVTVLLEESAPMRIAVLGEVARPGFYPLDAGAGLAQALASAGGLTEFAHRDRIYVVRQQPTARRIRFSYASLARADGRADTFRLRPGDVVVAE